MALFKFRFTPDSANDLLLLTEELTKVLKTEPLEEDEESVLWELPSGQFKFRIKPVLEKLSFSGKVLSDGEASSYPVEEWVFLEGKLQNTLTVKE